MSKRAKDGRYARKHSGLFVAGTWLAGVLSLGLLYGTGRLVAGDFGMFRSCNHNNTGLSVTNCGKQGINLGDLMVLLVFVLCASLSVSLLTAAWRMTRNGSTT